MSETLTHVVKSLTDEIIDTLDQQFTNDRSVPEHDQEVPTETPESRSSSALDISQSSGSISTQQDQYAAERTYTHPGSESQDAIALLPAEYSAEMNDQEVAARLELNHVVKVAPRLNEQLHDLSRTNTIEYLINRDQGLRSTTSSAGHEGLPRDSIGEAVGLRELDKFFESAVDAESIAPDARSLAESMRKNLTYIGEKEYEEATVGIATYWKTLLSDNPHLQIYAIAGKIAEGGKYLANDGKDQVKSDAYMLDSVLKHFTDEEIESFKNRLIIDDSELKGDIDNTRVVLLDDWAISGTQLTGVANEFIARHPELEGAVEVQLIAATAARIKQGTLQAPGEDTYESRASMLPVRAYYMAHDADPRIYTQSGAHLTGSHCSVDYDFEDEVGYMAKQLFISRYTRRLIMPPLTNIVRVYRDSPLLNIARYDHIAETNEES